MSKKVPKPKFNAKAWTMKNWKCSPVHCRYYKRGTKQSGAGRPIWIWHYAIYFGETEDDLERRYCEVWEYADNGEVLAVLTDTTGKVLRKDVVAVDFIKLDEAGSTTGRPK